MFLRGPTTFSLSGHEELATLHDGEPVLYGGPQEQPQVAYHFDFMDVATMEVLQSLGRDC
jgi:hypothetical protein